MKLVFTLEFHENQSSQIRIKFGQNENKREPSGNIHNRLSSQKEVVVDQSYVLRSGGVQTVLGFNEIYSLNIFTWNSIIWGYIQCKLLVVS